MSSFQSIKNSPHADPIRPFELAFYHMKYMLKQSLKLTNPLTNQVLFQTILTPPDQIEVLKLLLDELTKFGANPTTFRPSITDLVNIGQEQPD